MVSSRTKKTISLAISLLVVVISLTGVALGAIAPNPVTPLTRYNPGFAGAPGKMARDAAGNFYVADFWGKGIVKLDKQGSKIGFIATIGRPAAVAVLDDNRLVVAMAPPQKYVAFYRQLGSAPNVSGEEAGVFTGTPPGTPLYRPTGIAVDAAKNIYVLDAGDGTDDAAVNVPKIRVYNPAGAYQYAIGTRTLGVVTATVLDSRLKQPAGIAYEKLSNSIVVADTLNGRLLYFSAYTGTPPMLPTSFIGRTAGLTPPSAGSATVTFGNPVDVAFQYDDTVLQRIYVAERGRDEISVLDPVATTPAKSTKLINDTTVSGASLKQPASLLFERTGTGTSTAGVLYVTNAATSVSVANILPLGIDNGTAPAPQTVTMTMAAVPATSGSSSITVTGTTNPGTAVACTVNGVAGGTPSGTTNWTVSGLVLQSGVTNYILCKSATGNASVEAYTYFGAPSGTTSVTITSPAAGLYTNNTTVNVTGTTTPANATVQLDNSLVGTTFAQSDANGNWSMAVTLGEGSNTLTATASKPGWTTGSNAQVAVVGDITPPNMTGTISFITAGSTTTNAVQNLDGIVLEANLQSITVDGVPVSDGAKVTLGGNNTYFSVPVTLERDSNNVTVTATDLAGNSTTLSRSVTLAPEKPGFTVTLPADNKFRTAVGTESASGTADPSFTTVIACGTSTAAGNWSATTPSIGTGFVSCQFTASGGGNTTVSEKRTFNTNGTYGLVAITYPATDIATKNASVTVSGSVTASASVPKISINGAAAKDVTFNDAGIFGTYVPATGAFTYPVALVQGLNTIKIISNTTTTAAVRNIIYDTTAPVMSIQADSKSMPTTISGSLEPSAKMSAITASLGGTPVIIPLSKITFEPNDQSGSVLWHADLASYGYDALSFTALDPALNDTTLAYAIGIPTGDVDGDGAVRLADALAALRHVAGTENITDPDKFFNGDVGGLIKGRAARDGVIDITDSVLILNKAYGLMAF